MMPRPHCRVPDACAAKKPTTHCRRCTALRLRADPEIEARRRAASNVYHADPAVKAVLAARIRAAQARALEDPAYRERLREHGHRQVRNHLNRPDVRERNRSPEVRRRAADAISATALADIPPDLRSEYRRLVRSKRMSAAEARACIAAHVRHHDPEGRPAAQRAIRAFERRQRERRERERAEAY